MDLKLNLFIEGFGYAVGKKKLTKLLRLSGIFVE